MLELKRFYLPYITILLILLHGCKTASDNRNQVTPRHENISAGLLQPESFKHIILTWQGDPRISQAVTWRTDIRISQALAEIAPSDPSPDFGNIARQFTAQSTMLETDRGVRYYHTVNFRISARIPSMPIASAAEKSGANGFNFARQVW